MRFLFISFLAVTIFFTGTFVFAQEAPEYIPMVKLPGMDAFQAGDMGTEKYVNALYALSITVAALLAVLQIIYGGVQYMLTDVVPSKSEGTKRIKGALLGLLIVLSAVLILNTINEDLTNINIFRSAPKLELPQSNLLQTIIADPNDQRGGTTPTISVCDLSNSRSCASISSECQSTPGYVSVQQTGPNKITCFIKK